MKKIESHSPQKRLIKLIEDCYQEYGGYIDDENNLQVEGRQISLKPLLGLFDNIANSKEFTLLSPLFDTQDNFPIANMYVELAVSRATGLTDPLILSHSGMLYKALEEKHQQERTRRLTIEQAVQNPKHHHLVILGDPGSGKTSLLKYLTLNIAKGKSPRWIVPIHISLRQYWQEKKNYEKSNKTLTLVSYAAIRLINEQGGKFTHSKYTLIAPELWDENLPHVAKLEERACDIEGVLSIISGPKKNNILFLLDGFDELASQQDAVDSLTMEIEQLSHGFSWVLTSRHTGFYGGLNEDRRYEMISLHNQGIEDLVSNWFNQVQSSQSKENKKSILSQIQSNSRLLNMARNPFLLTLLCYIQHRNNQLLPLQRSEIYKEIIKLIRQQLHHTAKNNALFGKIEYNYLKKFCYYLYTGVENAPRQLFSLDHWQECALPDKSPSLTKHFLPSRLISNWQPHDDYHFSHLTFQEYFIALHLAKLPVEKVEQYIYKSHWKMVFRFLAGIYWSTNKQKKYKKLLTKITKPIDLSGFLYIEAAWFLTEAGLKDSTNIIGKDLRKVLWGIWCSEQIHQYTFSQGYKDIIAEALTTLDSDYVYSKIMQTYDLLEIPPKMIFLLGSTTSQEPDRTLISLFFHQDIKPNIEDAVILAIANKATPEIRSALLIESKKYSEEWVYFRLNKLAKETKHTDFSIHLLKQLEHIDRSNLNEYNSLYRALCEISNPDFEGILKKIVLNNINLNELPIDLLKAFASLHTEFVKNWFVKNAFSSTKILSIAIQNNWLSAEIVIKHLNNSSTTTQDLCTSIDAIRTYIESGEILDKRIEAHIAEIAFSDHRGAINALRVLVRTERNKLDSKAINNTYLDKYRMLLDSKDTQKVAIAIEALSYINDFKSLGRIIRISNAKELYYDQELAINVIDALAHFSSIGEKEKIIKILKSTIGNIKEEYDELNAESRFYHEQLLQLSLENLIRIDVGQMGDYLEFPQAIIMDIVASFTSEKGFLFFKDFYITPQGQKYKWGEKKQFTPFLDLSISANEQQHGLRQMCQYLLDEGKASKAGKYIPGNKKTPLFQRDKVYGSDATEAASISRKTGDKFLKGNSINAREAQKLMNWIRKNFRKESLNTAFNK